MVSVKTKEKGKKAPELLRKSLFTPKVSKIWFQFYLILTILVGIWEISSSLTGEFKTILHIFLFIYFSNHMYLKKNSNNNSRTTLSNTIISRISISVLLYLYSFLSLLRLDSWYFYISSVIHFSKLYFLVYLIDRTGTTRWICSYTWTICSHSTALMPLHTA